MADFRELFSRDAKKPGDVKKSGENTPTLVLSAVGGLVVLTTVGGIGYLLYNYGGKKSKHTEGLTTNKSLSKKKRKHE